MKSRVVGLAAVVVVAALPFLTGCAEEEYDAQNVAYPQPIGYTTPPSEPAQAGVQAQAQAAAAEPPGAAPEQFEAPAQFAPSAAGDYALGDESAAPASDEYADDDPSALTDFRSTLDPYGSWVDDPTYGTVWVPSPSVVGSDFTPYVTAGHWAYDDDYTWVSDYDWGWAPFHYGRWAWASGYGWEWIPGREYAGAWVSWRYGWGDWDYVGWAPLGPTWCWQGGAAVGLGFVPAAPYAFVGTGELFAPSIGSRVVTGSQVGVIGAHTRPYVPASPSVNGRVAATPRVGGPPPAMLHIPASAVAHAGTTSRGLMQARAFARPSTAMAMGARAPQGYAGPRAAGGFARSNVPGNQAPYRSPYASHFGGKLGYGFRGSAASAPPAYSYRAPTSFGSRAYSGGEVPHGTAPAYRGSYGGFRGGYSRGYSGGYSGGYSHYGSGFRGAPGFAGHAPPAATPSGGSHSSGGYSSGGTGGYHGGSFRGGGYHGGGFGGFHGGGGGHGGGGHR